MHPASKALITAAALPCTAAVRAQTPGCRRGGPLLGLLAAAGADLHRLENDRYDCVTIAAVAADEETLRVLLALGASARLVPSAMTAPR